MNHTPSVRPPYRACPHARRILAAAFALILHSPFSILNSSAAVPLKWTVETSRVQPAVFDVVRGETIELEAAFNSYGKPLATTNQTAFLAWQTNGMDSAWWITNAVTSLPSPSPLAFAYSPNLATATFTPDMDPGAPTITGFIGLSDTTNSSPSPLAFASSLSYRAAFTLRFRKGPGATPNAITIPPRVLDLAHTTVVNPPWPTQADYAATTTVMKAELKAYVDGEIEGAGLVTPQSVTNAAGAVASNVVTKAYVESLGIESGLDTNAVATVITNHVTSGYLCTEESAQQKAAAAEAAAKAKATEVGYVADEALSTAQSAYQLADDAWTGMGDYLLLEGGEVGYLDISGPLNVTGNEVQLPDATKVSFGLYTLANYLMFGEWNAPATSPNLHFMSKTEVDAAYRDKGDIDVYDEPGVPGGPRYQPTGNKLANTNQVRIARDEAIQAAKEYSDARYAPTSTAVTVASHASQLSQLSQSVNGVQSSISTLNNGYTRLYNFATGATNANFSATNYPPTAAAAATRCHYQPEQGMDFSTVPASLQLNEYREGAWRTVMDTRDWTVWYYRFKEIQLTNEIARLKAQNAVISNNLENAKAWANHTANGVENPMTDTLVVDRPNMWLMADYEWQKCVSGSNQCFVIRAKNMALSGGANTNGFLEICDAFGRPYMRVNKSSETFAEPVFSNITYSVEEGAWYVVFGNTVKPTTGGANAEIFGNGTGKCILYAEDNPECPATITWPESADSHAGHWIMKAVPKPVGGVVPSKMFFGAEIKVAGKDYVEYVKEASFGAGIRVGNNVYEAVESGNTLIWTKRND